MAKTLVIKGANFSTNKVATVVFADKPCTGISLSDGSKSMEFGDTYTLTATVTPSDTTDSVVWTTSNSSIVTVNAGVLTAVGSGSATITATCGSYSATCSVTVATATMHGTNISGHRLNPATAVESGGNGLGYLGSSSKYGAIVASTGDLPLYVYGSGYQETVYPYKIPQNTAKIRITSTNASLTQASVGMFNSQTNAGSEFSTAVKFIYSTELTDFSNGVVEANIPTLSGQPTLDSIVVSLKSSEAFTDNDFSGVTIEFVPAT